MSLFLFILSFIHSNVLKKLYSIHKLPVLVACMAFGFNPQKSDWQTSHLEGCAGISDINIFLPSISSVTSFSAHRQHTHKNKHQIRYQKRSCLLLAHMEVAQICWCREGAVEACWRAEGQGLIPSWLASFQPRGTNVLQRSKAWHLHPTPPMIDALSAPYSREKALDICIIDWGWEKKRGKGWKKGGKEDRLWESVLALDIGHTVSLLVVKCECKNEMGDISQKNWERKNEKTVMGRKGQRER